MHCLIDYNIIASHCASMENPSAPPNPAILQLKIRILPEQPNNLLGSLSDQDKSTAPASAGEPHLSACVYAQAGADRRQIALTQNPTPETQNNLPPLPSLLSTQHCFFLSTVFSSSLVAQSSELSFPQH